MVQEILVFKDILSKALESLSFCGAEPFVQYLVDRALTHLFGNGAGAHGIGKIRGVLT